MIGERLLELRKDADLTQDDLAAILKINKHSISAYERNKSEPPDDIKIAIARYFQVSIDYLLGLTDNPAPYSRTASALRLCRLSYLQKPQIEYPTSCCARWVRKRAFSFQKRLSWQGQ